MDKQQLIVQLEDIRHDVIVAICSMDNLDLYFSDFQRIRIIQHLLGTNEKLNELVKQLAVEMEEQL